MSSKYIVAEFLDDNGVVPIPRSWLLLDGDTLFSFYPPKGCNTSTLAEMCAEPDVATLRKLRVRELYSTGLYISICCSYVKSVAEIKI